MVAITPKKDSRKEFLKQFPYREITLSGQTIKYHHSDNGKEPLLFLHGLGSKPEHYYRGTVKKLAKDFDLIAPIMYAINEFKPQPTTIEEYIDMTKEFCEKVGVGEHYITGHCIGASIGVAAAQDLRSKGVIALSPVMPVDFGFFGYVLRAFVLEYNAIRGGNRGGKEAMKYAFKVLGPFMGNMWKKPYHSMKVLKDLSNFDYEGVSIDVPTIAFYPEGDEFYNLQEEILQGTASNLEIKRLDGKRYTHNWAMWYAGTVARHVKNFVGEQKEKEALEKIVENTESKNVV